MLDILNEEETRFDGDMVKLGEVVIQKAEKHQQDVIIRKGFSLMRPGTANNSQERAKSTVR